MPEVAAGVPVRWLDAGRAVGVAGRRRRRRHPPAAGRRRPGAPALRRGEGRPRRRRGVGGGPLPAHGPPDPATAVAVDYDDRDLLTEAPPAGGRLRASPTHRSSRRPTGPRLQRDLVDWLVRNRTIDHLHQQDPEAVLPRRRGPGRLRHPLPGGRAGEGRRGGSQAAGQVPHEAAGHRDEAGSRAGEGLGGRRAAQGAAERAAGQCHRLRARRVPRRAPPYPLADRGPQHGGPVGPARQRPAATRRPGSGRRRAGAGAPAGAGRASMRRGTRRRPTSPRPTCGSRRPT